MRAQVEYSRAERVWLALVSVVGFAVLNGALVYGLLFQPDAVAEALSNPIAVAFIVEALVLVGVLAFLLRRWHASRLGWGWFATLSFLGGLAIALPVVLLFPARKAQVTMSSLDPGEP